MKEMTPDAARHERFARAYAQSHLKQHYDAVVVDDACGIGGFLWKFPSEGSNSSSNSSAQSSRHAPVLPLALDSRGDAALGHTPAYPRKCSKCERAWVSDRSAERRHRRVCTESSSKSRKMSSTAQAEGRDESHTDVRASLCDTRAARDSAQRIPGAKLGVARRVWCEVDSTLSQLQWRVDKASAQDDASCAIPFSEILEVTQLQDVPNSFQIITTAPRTVVFQCRPRDMSTGCNDDCDTERSLIDASAAQCMDAEQWCEYLDVFSRYARQQQSNQRQSPQAKDAKSLASSGEAASSASNAPAFDERVFARITRAIIHDDVSALDALLATDAKAMARVTDDSGSSLLIVGLKLGAGAQIIQTLLRAGVDCNALNHDQESALLLVAASGDDELLDVLLQADAIDVNQRCSLGATAFHAAANAGDVRILELLCAAGACTSAVDANGWTALHYAAACPTGVDAMHFLCELVPELLDCQCHGGNTALHVASGYGCVENVRALLETAANPHVANSEGQTAYHVALQSHKIPCAVVINEYMANTQELYATASPRRDDGAETTAAVAPLPWTSSSATMRPQKEDAVSAPSAPLCHRSDELFAGAWVEYATPDGLPYFYNTSTGASSWHKPPTRSSGDADLFGTVWDDGDCEAPPFDTGVHGDSADAPDARHGRGEQLPLCLIPMASLLASLDDPTAAAKIDSKRKRARERRRALARRSAQQ